MSRRVTPLGVADLADVMGLETVGFDRLHWSQESWREELASDRHHTIGAHVDGGLAAMASFAEVGDATDLNRVVVHPDHRKQGLATALLEDGLAWTRGLGVERMLLEVEQTNAPAVALYRQLGFAVIDTRPHYYGPDQHALIMQRGVMAR